MKIFSLFRSGFPQEETSLFNAFFRLYFWPNLKNSPLSSAPQFVQAKNSSRISSLFSLKKNEHRFLSVDTSAVIADQLRFSSTSNDETNQKFFLGDSQVPYRVLAIRIHLATIFCFFKDGKIAQGEKQKKNRRSIGGTDVSPLFFSFRR